MDESDETHESATDKPSGLARVLPILDWSRRYDRSLLRKDLVAGLAVAALVVPKSLGYTGIAGVLIQHGSYAAAAETILYALFGTVRQTSTGPSSALAVVVGSAVVLASVSGDEAVELVAAITVVTGLLFLLLAIFKMGWIAGLDDIHVATLVVGAVSLAVIVGIRFSPIKAPGALVLVAGGLVAFVGLDFDDRGIALVGEVPRGFVAPKLPSPDFVIANISTIAPAALGLLLIGFSQTAGDAWAFASKHGYPIDIDQDSIAQSTANVGSGVPQGIPVSTTLSASSLNDESGAKTPLASLTTGVLQKT